MSLSELYGTYEINRFNAELYEIGRDRVLGLQALLMSELLPIAVTQRNQNMRPPKATGFTFLMEDSHIDIDPLSMSEDTPEEVVQEKVDTIKAQIQNSGSDRYFGVMARRLSRCERRLSISLLQYSLEDDIEASTRTVHQFLWRSDSDIALGSRREVFAGSDAKLLTSSVVDDQLQVMRSGDDHRSVFTNTPTGHDFDELEQQVRQTIEVIKSVA